MKRKLLLLALGLTFGLQPEAAVPSADQLLPIDTVAVLSLPDAAQAFAACATNATGRLWADPAMRPFREHLASVANQEFIAPLERELGLKLSDYPGLLQGQVTLAWVRTGPSSNASTGWLLLADARERSNDLALQLTGLRKKLAAANPLLRTEKLHDLEFTTLALSNGSLMGVLQRAFAAPEVKREDSTNAPPAMAPEATEGIRLTFGQSGSLLIVGSDTNALQGILSRLTGGGGPTLRDNLLFQKEHQRRFKEALFYTWVNLQPLIEGLVRWVDVQDTQTRDEDPKRPMPKRAKLLAATGVTAARAAGFAWRETAEGSRVELDLEVPATNRAGLFKLVEFEPHDSGPPPFVPVEAVTFQRYRLSLPKAWVTLEQMFIDVFPPARSVLNFLLQTAGKDSDANYDLKAELLSNLGDDIIMYELAPRTNTLADLRSPPSMSLVGSTNADRLLTAFKAAAGLFMGSTERTVQGRKVYSFSLPATATGDTLAGGSSSLSAAAAATNFVALSTATNLLESGLSRTNAPTRTLNELPGFTEAAQQVGGTNTGWFGYENATISARVTFETLQQHPDSALALVPPAYLLAITGLKLEEPLERLLAKCDFARLPAFGQVAKYFHFSVYTGSVDAEGYHYRSFSPVPPALVTKPAESPPPQSPSK